MSEMLFNLPIDHFLQESETSQKKECRWQQPVSSMALRGGTIGEALGSNSLAYSSITGDPVLCEQQFTR